MSDPITVGVTENSDDLTAIYRLRYEVYCYELRALDPTNYPDKQEVDVYDEYSIHIIARRGQEIAGAMRLIRDNERGFAMEKQFLLPPTLDRSKTVEHSRVVIPKKYRGVGILDLLLEAAYSWQRERGITTCIGAAVTHTLGPKLLKLGYRPLGPAIAAYDNVMLLPVVYRLENSPTQ
ncbi:MAG: GNAT family N-acyltransferase [Candidatus Liptonbacteria bacterium]|nr:GNAT family N-acyltransferase [Candidatus Liptonbacteria bacterium]